MIALIHPPGAWVLDLRPPRGLGSPLVAQRILKSRKVPVGPAFDHIEPLLQMPLAQCSWTGATSEWGVVIALLQEPDAGHSLGSPLRQGEHWAAAPRTGPGACSLPSGLWLLTSWGHWGCCRCSPSSCWGKEWAPQVHAEVGELSAFRKAD